MACAEGRDFFFLESIDISNVKWRKTLFEIFPVHSEEFKEIEKFVMSEPDFLNSRKHFEINDIYIFVNISQVW
jgi:hypothetical protein